MTPFGQRYFFDGGLDEVERWLSHGAVTTTLAIDHLQKASNICGNVVEIGVHHGKYFIVLKNLCAPNERAIAVDVFEDQHLNVDGSGLGNRVMFENNIATYTDGERISIIQNDSTLLRKSSLIIEGNVRIFSIDGSHTADHTFSDLMLAADTLAEGGVIILDDLYSPHWPGVQEGFHRFMSSMHTRFSAVSIGDNKLYLCFKADHERYLRFFTEELAQFSTDYKEVIVWGSSARTMSLGPPEKVFSRDGQFRQNTFLLNGFRLSARCKLISGWSHNGDGVWTIGDQSIIELTPETYHSAAMYF
jgi:hypothetical protein